MANSARYEVAINGFYCLGETWDDALNRDGNHDEVFFVVNTKVVKGTGGDVLLNTTATSATLGDVNGFTGRVQAGSGRTWWGLPSGGIISGDSYPSNEPWRQTTDPTGRNFPPYTIWSGELTQGSDEVVFLTPTLWELDQGADAMQGWVEWQARTDQTFGQRAKDVYGSIWPVSKPFFDAISLGIQTFASLPGMWSPIGSPRSRPIGLQRDPATPDGTTFNPIIISLTYDMAEYLANADPTGKGPGILGYRYTDDAFLRGDYQIWLQIKKVSDTQADSGRGWSSWQDLGGQVTAIDAARNSDGRLEVFGVGTDSALYNMSQASPGGAWSGWNRLGGSVKKIAVVSNADGRLESFAIGQGDALHHIYQSSPGAWSRWESLGGAISEVAAAINRDGRLEVFGIGTDLALYHIWQVSPGGSWSSWNRLGGSISKLTVAANSDGRLEVVAIGQGGAVYHIWQVSPGGAWSSWAGLGGSISEIDVAVNEDGRLEAFGIGTDHALYHVWQVAPGGGWSGWDRLGGEMSKIAACTDEDGSLAVLAIGNANALYQIKQTGPGGGWTAWQGLGGAVTEIVTAKSHDRRIEVFGIGAAQALYRIHQN